MFCIPVHAFIVYINTSYSQLINSQPIRRKKSWLYRYNICLYQWGSVSRCSNYLRSRSWRRNCVKHLQTTDEGVQRREDVQTPGQMWMAALPIKNDDSCGQRCPWMQIKHIQHFSISDPRQGEDIKFCHPQQGHNVFRNILGMDLQCFTEKIYSKYNIWPKWKIKIMQCR